MTTQVALPHFNSMVQKSKSNIIIDTEMDSTDIIGTSLCLFDTQSKLRRVCAFVAKNKAFENIILVLIGISTVNLALESPFAAPDS